MKKITEIIYQDNLIETVNDILPLNIGDTFYFSIKGTTIRSENEYICSIERDGYILKKDFINEIFANINEDATKFNIKEFKVVSISRSYERNYNVSIEKPELVFVVSIHVIEI